MGYGNSDQEVDDLRQRLERLERQLSNLPARFAVGGGGSELFRVTVEKDGGADGSMTTRATWRYTVKDAAGKRVLAENVSLGRLRPIGKMTPGGGTGWAYYEGRSLKLWDANETEDVGDCA